MWMESKQADVPAYMPDTYRDAAKQALEEWRAAVNYFDRVSDPDLVEFATYQVEAARRKYECLMRRARLEAGPEGQ